jgi:hypothetical protein
MTNEMKLITALCDALGFEVEKTCVNEDERQAYIRAGASFDPERVYKYKLTSRSESATEADIYNQAIDAAAEVVRERFDEQEPWLEVEDILKLKVTT